MREYLKGTMLGAVVAAIAFVIYATLTDQLKASTELMPLMVTLIAAGAAVGTLLAVYIARLAERELGR